LALTCSIDKYSRKQLFFPQQLVNQRLRCLVSGTTCVETVVSVINLPFPQTRCCNGHSAVTYKEVETPVT